MSDERLETALRRLPAVDLEGLDIVAPLQARRDRKYLVPVADAVRLLQLLPDGARVLAIGELRSFRYESVYLDTPGLASYLAAARGRPRRWKVRIRTYVETGGSVLEIKRHDRRGRTVKVRKVHPDGLGTCLNDDEREGIAACSEIAEQASLLRPVLQTAYRRSTVLLEEGLRMTIDTGLCSTVVGGGSVSLPGVAVVETKSLGPPCAADRTLWGLGHRPVRVSKYCTSFAALRPELASSRWTRALQRPWMRGAGARHEGRRARLSEPEP